MLKHHLFKLGPSCPPAHHRDNSPSNAPIFPSAYANFHADQVLPNSKPLSVIFLPLFFLSSLTNALNQDFDYRPHNNQQISVVSDFKLKPSLSFKMNAVENDVNIIKVMVWMTYRY